MPKPDEASKAFFRSVVPEGPAVTVRPMFGNLAAFVNGNMFSGLFGPDLFVRVSEEDRAVIEAGGGGPFEPMPGRRMTGYTMLPVAWRTDRARAEEWVARALAFASGLPAKQPKAPKPRKPRR